VNSELEAAEAFYSGALRRITWTMPVIGAVAMPLLLWRWRWPVAAGFAFGAVLSVYNFRSLSRSVEALANRISGEGSRESGGMIVGLLVLRYLVIAAGAYVIFKGSVAVGCGLLGGLFLPIAAIGCEAAFEMYVALRRGF
jgi:hypothetical protein